MTIRDVQDVTGVSAAAVTKWQSGNAIPSIDNLVVLAALWGVQMDDIVVTRVASRAS